VAAPVPRLALPGAWTSSRRRLAGRASAAWAVSDLQFAVVDDPGEGFFDRAARNLCDQAQVPGQIGLERVEVAEAGQAAAAAGDLQRTKMFELADDAQWVVAAHEQRRGRGEANLPGLRLGRLAACRHGGGLHRCGCGHCLLQPVMHGLDRDRIGWRAVFGLPQQCAQHVH